MIFFGDIAWFYLSARDALLAGAMPILGITSSITWLHQGPLWTYLLIPALFLSRFHPISGSILAFVLNIFSLPLLFFLAKRLWGKRAAAISVLLFLFNPLAPVHFTLAYHTSPIPLFSILYFLLLLRGRSFLAGLFLGFLYQLHLLTFILWPIAAIGHKRLTLGKFIPGFAVGILPFLMSGPIQTFGIFIWLAKQFLTDFSGVGGGLSEAYLIVLLIPTILMLARFVSRLPKITWTFAIVASLLISNFQFPISNYGPSLQQRLALSRQILSFSSTASPQIIMSAPLSRYRSSSMPYEYLTWWLSLATSPSGTFSAFLIDEPTSSIKATSF